MGITKEAIGKTILLTAWDSNGIQVTYGIQIIPTGQKATFMPVTADTLLITPKNLTGFSVMQMVLVSGTVSVGMGSLVLVYFHKKSKRHSQMPPK